MSDKSGWDRLIDEVSGPGDWAAAIVGGAVGAVGTFYSGGADMGTMAASGAVVGVSAKKATVAAFQRRLLLARARRFEKLLDAGLAKGNDGYGTQGILESVRREIILIENKISEIEDSEKAIDELIKSYRGPV